MNYQNKIEQYQLNIALSYDYVENNLKELQNNIEKINTKLGLLIGFDFTFARFFILDLPAKFPYGNSCINNHINLPCYSCWGLKFIAYICCATSLIYCLKCFSSKTVDVRLTPDQLIENSNSGSNIEFKKKIIEVSQKVIMELVETKKIKSQSLKVSINCLVFSGLLSILDVIIASIFYSN